jgi:uncharacterized protein
MSATILKNQRIEVIDVLRGFALFGIILVHMVEQYYAGQMPEAVTKAHPGSVADNIALGFVSVLIMGKFYMIFSFLFGLSFSIQSANGSAGDSFLARFGWRLFLLFVIGMLHHVHYRGDILGIYAILGFVLLLFFRASDRLLLVLGLLLVFNIPSFLIRLGEGIVTGSATLFPEQDKLELVSYYEAVKRGGYYDILKHNYYGFATKMAFQFFSGRIFITFGLFLLGYYAGRKNIFSTLSERTVWLKKLLSYSWKTILAIIVLLAIIFGGAHLLKLQLPQFIQFAIGGFAYDVFNACMALLYLGGVVLLFQKQRWKRKLMNFYEVGRMGLTTYVLQSMFGFFIFFSPGLGLLNELGGAVCFVLGIVLFIVQIVFARLWLSYFNYGPLEWAWRSLTYFRWQPLLKERGALSSAN